MKAGCSRGICWVIDGNRIAFPWRAFCLIVTTKSEILHLHENRQTNLKCDTIFTSRILNGHGIHSGVFRFRMGKVQDHCLRPLFGEQTRQEEFCQNRQKKSWVLVKREKQFTNNQYQNIYNILKSIATSCPNIPFYFALLIAENEEHRTEFQVPKNENLTNWTLGHGFFTVTQTFPCTSDSPCFWLLPARLLSVIIAHVDSLIYMSIDICT